MCLSPTNAFRMKAAQTVEYRAFDPTILVIIVLSSVALILENPLTNPNSLQAKALVIADVCITTIFTFELILKTISYGFVFNGKLSYLRSGWNILDILTVIISWFSIALGNSNLSAIKVLRILRVLRPLRMISRNESLKLQIKSLILSIPGIINVLILSCIFFLLFGIFFTNFYKGQFFYCHTVEGLEFDIITKWDCLDAGGEWLN